MNRKETVKDTLILYRPYGVRKKGSLYSLLAMGLEQKPNKQRSIYDRTIEALRSFDGSMHFLAGIVTVYPFLKIQKPMLEFEAEKLLLAGSEMRGEIKATTAFIRRMRVHEEKILKLVTKIEKIG